MEHALGRGRQAWLQVARGSVAIDSRGQTLEAGDGAAIIDDPLVKISGVSDQSEILLFDLE